MENHIITMDNNGGVALYPLHFQLFKCSSQCYSCPFVYRSTIVCNDNHMHMYIASYRLVSQTQSPLSSIWTPTWRDCVWLDRLYVYRSHIANYCNWLTKISAIQWTPSIPNTLGTQVVYILYVRSTEVNEDIVVWEVSHFRGQNIKGVHCMWLYNDGSVMRGRGAKQGCDSLRC